jgi:uncharacterized protein (TIGR02284 family)
MAVQTEQQKARDRVMVVDAPDEAKTSRSDAGHDSPPNSRHLLHLLERSAQHVRHASESVENRGLKTLLKVLAQERVVMVNALRQALGKDASDPLDPDHKSGAASMQEGLQDIQASMTVQRQGRENVALNHLLEAEDELLRAYDASLQGTLSPQLRSMLESQQAHITQFYRRLQAVDVGIEPIVARVFDSRVDGESAVARLRERGLDPAQIDMASITQVARPVMQTAVATASPRKSMAAGAFSGAVIGGIIGLVLASFAWFAPESVGWFTLGPWLLFAGATLLGIALGTVFGFFIGQSQREDDIAVTADSLVNGEILVVAYPSPQQISMVEDVLQVHHARELNR